MATSRGVEVDGSVTERVALAVVQAQGALTTNRAAPTFGAC